MMTVEGKAQRLIDEKNRIVWPKEWQAEVSSGLYIFRWIDPKGQFLMAVPSFNWEVWKDENLSKDKYDPDKRVISGFVFAMLKHVVPGTNGRILFPKELMDYAGLDAGKDVHMIRANGEYRMYAGDRFENIMPTTEDALKALQNLEKTRNG